MHRFIVIPILLIVLVVGPFLIWGDSLAAIWLSDHGSGGEFADPGVFWLIAIGLLLADIAIPIPTTLIIAALGIVYGPVIGALFGVAGTMAAALVGWCIGRYLGRPIAARLVGDAMSGGEELFARHGGWIVALSRWAPVLPEVVSVVAGVSRMPLAHFLAAALCGVIPFCAVFALMGHLGAGEPFWTMLIAALVPFVLWWAVRRTKWARRMGIAPE